IPASARAPASVPVGASDTARTSWPHVFRDVASRDNWGCVPTSPNRFVITTTRSLVMLSLEDAAVGCGHLLRDPGPREALGREPESRRAHGLVTPWWGLEDDPEALLDRRRISLHHDPCLILLDAGAKVRRGREDARTPP